MPATKAKFIETFSIKIVWLTVLLSVAESFIKFCLLDEESIQYIHHRVKIVSINKYIPVKPLTTNPVSLLTNSLYNILFASIDFAIACVPNILSIKDWLMIKI